MYVLRILRIEQNHDAVESCHLSLRIGGLIISVSLCMSPCSSDYIFNCQSDIATRSVMLDELPGV